MVMRHYPSRCLSRDVSWDGLVRQWPLTPKRRLKERPAQQCLRGFSVFCLTALCLAGAHAADPISISVAPATQKTFGNTVVWQAPAPSGSNLVIKAKPEVFAQTKTVTLKWKGYQGTDQVWIKPPPGPNSVPLGANGQASVPIKFSEDSYKQWLVTACANWQPPGYDHKIDDCIYVYLEGVDPIASNASNFIKIVSPAHPGLTHNWVKIPMQGSSIGVSVQNDVLAKSNDKVVRIKYSSSSSTSQPGTSWPAPTEKTTPKTISLSGAASQGGWTQKSEPLTPDPNMGEWMTVKACLTLDYSGEVCSASYAYQLTKPKLKPGMDQNPVIDPGKQPPLPPQGGGGGQAGQGGNLPAGNARMMAPPPVLGAPAANPPGAAAPSPPIQPASPTMAPAVAPPAMQSGRTAPTARVPGCSASPGVSGQFACATAEAYAGCERMRSAGSTGVQACQNSSGRLRR